MAGSKKFLITSFLLVLFIIGCKVLYGPYREKKNKITYSGPSVFLLNTPPSITNQQTTDIIVAGSGMVAYKYKLDTNAWSSEIPITTHIQLSNLAHGQHTLYVCGKQSSGNWQPDASATTLTWNVDVQGVVAMLSGLPSNPTTDTTTDITVSGTNVTHYKYKLDGGSWTPEIPIANHITLSGLSNQNHTLYVCGKSTGGNWQADENATQYEWTVNASGVIASLSGTPASPSTSNSINVTVGGTGVVAYKWRLDGGAWSSEIAIGTPISTGGLSNGQHTLDVIGKNGSGTWQPDTTPTTHIWTVNTTGVVALLSDLPGNPTIGTTADITVGGVDIVSYKYKLDGGAWSGEISVGTKINLTGLSTGTHTIYVTGKNSSSTWQSVDSATTYSWQIITDSGTRKWNQVNWNQFNWH